MKRIKLTVAYDGTNYSGWQIQPNAPTIEAVLDEAVYKLTGESIHVTGASRTDAGVSAYGNVAVFDTESPIPADKFAYALNRYMPEDVSILQSEEVESDFHPRHCDSRKTYEYRILSSQFPIPQYRHSMWNVPYELDIEKMREAARYLVGEHDFRSFACVRTSAESTVRTIYSLDITSERLIKDSTGGICEYAPDSAASAVVYTIRVTGNGFLYNMVRIIAGTLVQVGRGQLEPEAVHRMLEAQDRTAAGQTAPPQGLTLMGIKMQKN